MGIPGPQQKMNVISLVIYGDTDQEDHLLVNQDCCLAFGLNTEKYFIKGKREKNDTKNRH